MPTSPVRRTTLVALSFIKKGFSAKRKENHLMMSISKRKDLSINNRRLYLYHQISVRFGEFFGETIFQNIKLLV